MSIGRDAGIRAASSADITDILRIENAGDASWSASAFADELKGGSWFHVAANGHHIVAFAVARFIGHEAELLKISVDPRFRKRGLATSLLIALGDACKDQGVGVCYLEVARKNTAAIRLYHSSGWCRYGMRKAYYPTPTGAEDAILMKKEFP